MKITVDDLHQRLKDIKIGGSTCLFSYETCEKMAPLINEINALKKEKNAIILAHSYVSPEILYGVADFVGDSYELSKKARDNEADTIVFAAVKFMAETAKLLSPEKTVLVPSRYNGCSLADAITADMVRDLKKEYPEHSFVCYINTTAEVKAECDVCVTSSNVGKIVAAIPNQKIYFLPDKLMGQNLIQELKAKGIKKEIRYFDGTCYVHETYDPEMIAYLRQKHSDLEVLSHPECSPEVVEASDFVGSTSQMISHVEDSNNEQFLMLTECGLSTRMQLERPDKQFVGSCTMCKYMKSNSLEDILRVLKAPDEEDRIHLANDTIQKAKHCIDEMFVYAEQDTAEKREHA